MVCFLGKQSIVLYVLLVAAPSFAAGISRLFVQSQLPLLHDKDGYVIEEIYTESSIHCGIRCIKNGCAGFLFRPNEQIVDMKCYDTPTHYDYTGTMNTTIYGRTCQRWDQQSPHVHGVTIEHIPGDNFERNYCRDPDFSGHPWCYTTDINYRWEFCDVSQCMQHGTNCRLYSVTSGPDSFRPGYKFYVEN